MRRIVFIALAFMLANATAAPLKIVTIQGPPWGFLDGDGQPTGMMYEIANRIAEVAGFSPTNALVPYARTALDIESGNADMTLRFSNEHMERVGLSVTPVVTMPVILVGPRGVQYRSLSELRGKTVGVVRTSRYVDAFDADSAIQKYAVNDYEIMARMIAMRRLDAGVGSSAGLYYGAYKAGVKPDELGKPLVLGNNDFILFLSKKSARPETIGALKAAVEKLNASGEIPQIVRKYTSTYDPAVQQQDSRR